MSLDESNENDNLATSIKRYDKKDIKSDTDYFGRNNIFLERFYLGKTYICVFVLDHPFL